MTSAFCTIITADYIHYALALYKSLLDFGKDVKLYVLISDGNEIVSTKIEEKYPGMEYINFSSPLTTPKDVMLEQFQVIAEEVMPHFGGGGRVHAAAAK